MKRENLHNIHDRSMYLNTIDKRSLVIQGYYKRVIGFRKRVFRNIIRIQK